MRCPFCSSERTQIRDSRPEHGGTQTRRRRVCVVCGGNFRTTETLYKPLLDVRKKDNRIEPFAPEKLRCALRGAFGLKAMGGANLDALVETLCLELTSLDVSVLAASDIGAVVMKRLKQTDAIAYLRFAIRHLGLVSFEEVARFLREHQEHQEHLGPKPHTPGPPVPWDRSEKP